MFRKVIYLIIVILLFTGCSRSNNLLNTNNNPNINYYYTTSDKVLYEYNDDYGVNKVGIDGTQNVSYLSNNNIQVATKTSFSIVSSSGLIEFRYEPNDGIASATIDTNLKDIIYYVNENRELKKFNRVDNEIEIVMDSIYPLPKQMIIDSQNSRIYYHTSRDIIRIDLNSLTKDSILPKLYPIQSIAVCKETNDIYFSSSLDGKIYKLSNSTNEVEIFHHSISAAGATIWLDEARSELYFSRSNGKDIQIKKINIETKKVVDMMTLFNINYINNLVIKGN